LDEWNWPLIDAQLENEHLRSLGAESWPRAEFVRQIAQLVEAPEQAGSWTGRFGTLAASLLAA
ncbi:MAG: leucyl/phenylalanyl-tRNA--protein transferase, partial [Gammaproteobacteria bacterium]|nr:leucyl/phenylalanyl-tRNA--protein transferase [Gammaproteobacteria bacterium]